MTLIELTEVNGGQVIAVNPAHVIWVTQYAADPTISLVLLEGSAAPTQVQGDYATLKTAIQGAF